MNMTLARALKEKNRLAGELNRCWALVCKENSRREDVSRTADVAELYETIHAHREALIDLKKKIGMANAGNLDRIYRMEECKNELKHLENMNTNESSDFQEIGDSNYKEFKRNVVFTAAQVHEMKQALQRECNDIQDELDEYNATTTIEFDSPLRRK